MLIPVTVMPFISSLLSGSSNASPPPGAPVSFLATILVIGGLALKASGGVAPVGPRDRRGPGIRDRRRIRSLRLRARRHGSLGGSATSPGPRSRPRLRRGLLDPPALVPAGGRDRRHPHDEQRGGGSARLVAPQEPRGRLPRRAGRHGGGRRGQPAGRARRDRARQRDHHERAPDPAHRGGRARGRGRRRGGLRRLRLPAEALRRRAGHPGSGLRRLSGHPARHAVRDRHEDRAAGGAGVPRGPGRRHRLPGGSGVPVRSDLPAGGVPGSREACWRTA